MTESARTNQSSTDALHKERKAVPVFVPLPLKLLQVLRLAHALMESSYRVRVLESERGKLEHLRRYFELDYELGAEEGSRPLNDVHVSHEKPWTQIGDLGRALIFPHGMFDYCRHLWGERPIRFAFIGHVTPARQRVLEAWFRQVNPDFRIGNSSLKKLWERITGGSKASASNGPSAELVCRSSDAGRQFPGKAWDDDYFRTLARAQFVICPNGDFVWTYRFFEAILCGAIPVVEERCSLYEGFFFYTMNERTSDFKWSEQVAGDNLKLAQERLTVPLDELDREIAAMLKR